MFSTVYSCFRRTRIGTCLPALPALVLALSLAADSAEARETALSHAGHRARQATLSLAAMAKRYPNASEAERPRLLTRMTELAEQRHALLADMMATTPGEVLRAALPEQVAQRMPAPAQALLEQHLELEGTLTVLYDDYPDGYRLRHLLYVAGRKVALHFETAPRGLRSGQRVRVTGLLLNDAMAVGSDEADLVTLALDPDGSGDGSASPGTAPALQGTLGERRTAVFLVNFRDRPDDQPFTPAEAHDLVFGEVSDFVLENSLGRTWLSGDVLGWYTLAFDQPTDIANCKSTDVAAGAQQAAQAAGVDLSAYDHYIYVFPQTSCFPTGSGTVGGSPSESWINGGWFRLKTVGHEFGHNLGLYHSGALDCADAVVGDSCQTYVYGDTMDIMGNQTAGHYNAFQKERLGWLDPAAGQIENTFSDGAHTLGVYELTDGSAPKALKVYRDIDPANGGSRWLYVEYRQATGFDDFLTGNVLDGIVVRMATDSDPTSSVLLDMTPASSSTWDWGDPALVFGQEFTDSSSGLTIAATSGDGSSASFDVAFQAPTCVHGDPVVTATPGYGPWVDAGTAVAYEIAVRNTDNGACGLSPFYLDASVPAGWSAAYADSAPSAHPGATATTTLTVVSAAGAAAGYHDIALSAQHGASSGHIGTASLTYFVRLQETNGAPTAVNDTASTAKATPVIIDVLANDSDPDNDTLQLASVGEASQGRTTINADGTVTYTPKRRFTGEDSFAYTISDGEMTATAMVTVSVTADTGDDTSGGKGKGGRKK